MEEHQADLVLRQAAEPATRRSALTAMLGSALALHEPDVSEAAKKAKRRKNRRKRKRRKGASLSLLKPIKLSVANQGPNPVTIQFGEYFPLKCCRTLNTLTVNPGQSDPMGTTSFTMFVWINDKYWLDILNFSFGPPMISVAVNGQSPPHNHIENFYGPWGNWCCRAPGFQIVKDLELEERRSFEFVIEGRHFILFRDDDTNYKEYQLLLPQGL
jgi:hypothetical protein